MRRCRRARASAPPGSFRVGARKSSTRTRSRPHCSVVPSNALQRSPADAAPATTTASPARIDRAVTMKLSRDKGHIRGTLLEDEAGALANSSQSAPRSIELPGRERIGTKAWPCALGRSEEHTSELQSRLHL